MCLSSETTTKTDNKTKRETELPGYVNEASQTAVDLATQAATTPVTPYTGQLVSPLSADEQAAMGWLRAYHPESQLPYALENIEGSAQAPTMERVVDEDGQLGSMDDYFNPYVQATLDPTLVAINDAWMQANNELGAMAAASGAYGDARHGILEAENTANAAAQVQDATYQAYNDAWNQSMGYRTSDINRFTQQEQDYYQRQLDAAAAAMNAAASDQAQQLQLLQQRLAVGATQREVDQAGLTASYGEWLRQQEEEQRRIQQLASVNAGTPYEIQETGTQSGTSTTVQPDNSGLALAGALGSAALAPATGGASLALGAGSQLLGPSGGTFYPGSAPTYTTPYSPLPWLY